MTAKSQKSRVESQNRGLALRSYPQPPAPSPQPPRSALTLIELLVVIIILTTIVAAAIPIMTPADDDRRLREASRAVNTFISSAQSRAIAHNRPVGIALKRLSQDTGRDEDRGTCVQIFYIEQLPPYAGFDENSKARLTFYPLPPNSPLYEKRRPLVLIQFVTRGVSIPINTDGLPVGWDADLFPAGMIRPDDVIEIGGTQYRLLADPNDPDVIPKFDANGYFASDTGRTNNNKAVQIVAQALNDTGQMMNMTHDDRGFEIGTPAATNTPFFTSPSRYKILRQATPTSDEPYQMPEGMAIDLRASGLGNFDYFYWPGLHDNNDPIMILFSPEGKVSRLRFNKFPNATIFDEPVVDDLYLLVGARQKAVLPLAANDPTLDSGLVAAATTPTQKEKLREPLNWLSGSSRWIVIGSQSGRIATVGNAFVDLPTVFTMGNTDRELLRTDQIVAARELTRQTTQATGR